MHAPSATLAMNEELGRRRAAGEDVLPLAFGEAGLPPAPALRHWLATHSMRNDYGPVAGCPGLRGAAAGYWTRRRLPTDAELVVAGPGSKPLLFALLLAVGGDPVVARPSWVSYAAQSRLAGGSPVWVPAAGQAGGVPDPDQLEDAVRAARAQGRDVRSVVLTVPDNPTGTVAEPDTLARICALARTHDLVVISDEIYRDLVHDPGRHVVSAAELAPERTVVTTGLSKNLALGGWRLGVARLPVGALGATLHARLVSVASEIWSAPAQPVQQVAARAFDEPPKIRARIAASRRLHATVANAVYAKFRAAGLPAPAPAAAFYVYPDFEPLRAHLAARFQVHTSDELARLLLDRFGVAVLPGVAFGEPAQALRVRVATSLLYGETEAQREAALADPTPLELPWVAAALDRIEHVLTEVSAR